MNPGFRKEPNSRDTVVQEQEIAVSPGVLRMPSEVYLEDISGRR